MSLPWGLKIVSLARNIFYFCQTSVTIDRESESNWLLLALTSDVRAWAWLQGPARFYGRGRIPGSCRVTRAQETHSSGSKCSGYQLELMTGHEWKHMCWQFWNSSWAPRQHPRWEQCIDKEFRFHYNNLCTACCLLWGGSQLWPIIQCWCHSQGMLLVELQV